MRKYYIILCLWIIVSCKVDKKQLPYYDTPDFTPKWEMKNESNFHKIRPFELINQENESPLIINENIKNIIYSLVFIIALFIIIIIYISINKSFNKREKHLNNYKEIFNKHVNPINEVSHINEKPKTKS